MKFFDFFKQFFEFIISFWLFEIEFTDCLIVFTKKSVIFLFGQKKRNFCLFFYIKRQFLVDLINHYKAKFEDSKYNLVFLVKDPSSNTHNFQKLFEIIRIDSGVDAKWKIGGLPKEKQLGPFVTEYEQYVKLQECLIVDAGYFFQELYVIKDNIDLVKKIQKIE